MLLLDSKQDLRTYTIKQIVITARHSYQSILEYELEIKPSLVPIKLKMIVFLKNS